MACMNETFAFNQSHFATPVSADFGYADVTLASSTPSPRHRPPPSPSPRFQPSPLPFLQHPPPPSSPFKLQNPCNSFLAPPSPSSPEDFSTQPLTPRKQSSPSPSKGLLKFLPRSVTPEPNPQRKPPHPNTSRHSLKLPSSPIQRQRASSLRGVSDDLDKDVQPVVQTDLAVKKTEVKLEVNGSEPQTPESLAASCTSMGDSKENKSPRSSTSENLQTLSLREHYEVERELGRGTYGKVVLAKCKHTGTEVALKILPKSSTKLRDFQREFQLSYFLSPHSSIIDTYNVAFETKSSFVFAQEHAPLGDLFDAIPPQLGMREADAKNVVKQLASALEFMHSKHLVHRDIKPENVLVMAPDFTRVKLMDFGMTRKHGSMVRKTNGSIPYTPPEVCEAVRNENILVHASADVWALAVLLFCMLTGNFPWENADIGDVYFKEFVLWQRRKTTKLPSQWRRFTPRAMKFFRKALDVKPDRRCEIREIHKYLGDAWTQKARTNDSEEESGSSASDHMDELAAMLQDHGIETRVDRRLRERRISEWLLSL